MPARSPESAAFPSAASHPPETAPQGPPHPFPAPLSLWLRARDPFCVVAFWEADAATLQACAASRPGGSWRLLITGGHDSSRIVLEDALSLSLDHRFVAVPDPGCPYVAEIGFRAADGSWTALARSAVLSTPPAGPAPAWKRSAPESESGERLHALVELPPPARIAAPGAPRVEETQIPGADAPSTPRPLSGAEWVTQRSHTEALLDLVWERVPVEDGPSSADLSRWAARAVAGTAPESAPSTPPLPGSAEWIPGLAPGAAPSSGALATAPAVPPGFWFEVNAELIVYGRTERDARVTIGGRPVALRPDGSFTFRFTLPDGTYDLPVVAVNARNDDGRAARLEFSRATTRFGEVGDHPQDPALQPPVASAVS